ncbi:sorting nexin-8 [Biomphalaria pfeifferi]|uniref:Sorting nexin-8 n=1 Tax=Biomphalaria pfeifferi TaxID=112525 RepID=A0AAD8B5S0_BIOPF|nr:sorting nexin-8 [Biomphalaria pfeifferi]
MTADLVFGSIPSFYREVYDIVCPNQEQVDRDLFVQMLVKSSLPKHVIMQIWDLIDTQQGFMTRNGLYKALALTALAQQGKTVSDKLLETFSGQELPKPSLGDLSDLKAASLKIRRERMPNVLCFDFKDLCDIDSIKLELVPEKKGIILKHVEYEVTSKRHKATVLRRYNDFVALHELLTARFAYRIIPRLPPKKLGASREFIEQRRKCLRRYLNIVARHPQMHDDKLVKFFLTFAGNDVQYKIKEQFRGIPDEFMTSDMASKAKDLVPMDTQQQLAVSKEHIKLIHSNVAKFKEIAEGLVCRSTNYATDMLQLGRQFSIMSNDTTPITAWATGTSKTWERLQRGFRILSVDFASIADKSSQAAIDEEEGVVEKLAFFEDLILAYKDLCERHEKGVLHDHQRAIQKMGQYKKKKMSATVQNSDTVAVDQLEQKILEQEGEIANMENRNFYSLHCLQMETQLIYTYLDIFYEIVTCLARVEKETGSELSRIWSAMEPAVITLSPNKEMINSKYTGLNL